MKASTRLPSVRPDPWRQCCFERRGSVSRLFALGGSSMTCLRLVPDNTTITKTNLPASFISPPLSAFHDVLSSATKTASARSCRTDCMAIKLSRSSRFNSLMDDTVVLPATCPVLASIVSAQIRSRRNVFTR
jgi:hypothetical protein